MIIYLRKLFPHDLTHEVSVLSEICNSFFDGKKTLSFRNGDDESDKKNYIVTINSATDPRFGGDFKSIYAKKDPKVDDIIMITKKGGVYYLQLIKATSPKYSTFIDLFAGKNERHTLIYSDEDNNDVSLETLAHEVLNEEIKDEGDSEEETKNLDLEYIYGKINESGLIYDHFLVYRYVFSLLTKPFVILSGLAGSGKTQLALALANCLIEDADKQICFVPVGADWTNREPLLGYPSALDNNAYIMPESGVLQIILEAEKNPDKPYFLILDEMNLSYVERYFADFLSGMESKKEISLWSGNDEIPAKVFLPKNLFITGTINVDETTYMFSPKVLDRANVIEFKVSIYDMDKFLKDIPSPNVSSLIGSAKDMSKEFLEWAKIEVEPYPNISSTLLSFFKELKNVNAEFGYRVAVEISRFVSICSNFYEEKDFEEDDFVDVAILQKLLPKLHGSRKRLEKTLVALWDLCQDNGGKSLYEATFEDAEDAKYPESANKILRMFNAANENGFTSFAEA